jgi:hypothetical protein
MAAESYLKRKVGPLKMYQWIGLGVIAGLGLLLYNRNKPGEGPEGEVFGGTGTGAFGPINPETGVPYAFEGGAAGSAAESGLSNFGEFVDLVGTIRELFAPEETNTEPADAPAADPLAAAPKKKGTKTRQQRREDKAGAGHEKKGGKKPKHPATSTGAAGHSAQSHQAAPHPVARVGQAVAVATRHAKVGPGHAVGNGRPKTVRHPAVTHSAGIGGRGGANKRKKHR